MSASVISSPMYGATDPTGVEAGCDEPVATEAASAPMRGPVIEIELPGGAVHPYERLDDLRKDIVEGGIPESSRARLIPGPGADPAEIGWVDLRTFAIRHPGLRAVYRPIWDSALRFMGYGAMVGIALKLIDTTVTMFAVDDVLGLVWLAVIGSLALSSRWAMAPLAAVFLSIKAGIGINLFLTALGAGLVGAAFGAPAGLVIGTLVGHARGDVSGPVQRVEGEGARPYVLGLVLPSIYLAAAIPGYIWLNLKAIEWLAT